MNVDDLKALLLTRTQTLLNLVSQYSRDQVSQALYSTLDTFFREVPGLKQIFLNIHALKIDQNVWSKVEDVISNILGLNINDLSTLKQLVDTYLELLEFNEDFRRSHVSTMFSSVVSGCIVDGVCTMEDLRDIDTLLPKLNLYVNMYPLGPLIVMLSSLLQTIVVTDSEELTKKYMALIEGSTTLEEAKDLLDALFASVVVSVIYISSFATKYFNDVAKLGVELWSTVVKHVQTYKQALNEVLVSKLRQVCQTYVQKR